MGDSWCSSVVSNLEKCIDLIDKLMSICSRVHVGEQVSSSTLFQIYTIVVDLREKVVETRMIINSYCR